MHALIITDTLFEDSELRVPYEALWEKGVQVDIAAPEKREICGKHGHCVDPDLSIEEVDPERYDILVLPGGKAPARLVENGKVLHLVNTFAKMKRPIAAICHGPLILAKAGLLKGKKVTAYKEVAEVLKAAGAEFVDRSVVVDGNLITSRHPGDLPAFMDAIEAILGIE